VRRRSSPELRVYRDQPSIAVGNTEPMRALNPGAGRKSKSVAAPDRPMRAGKTVTRLNSNHSEIQLNLLLSKALLCPQKSFSRNPARWAALGHHLNQLEDAQ
jgi:hypothetical protein